MNNNNLKNRKSMMQRKPMLNKPLAINRALPQEMMKKTHDKKKSGCGCKN